MTTNKSSFSVLINGRIADLVAKRAKIIANEYNWAENTVHTQTYNVNRELKIMRLIAELVSLESDEAMSKLSAANLDALNALIEPKANGTTVTVEAGDKLMDLLAKKYADVKDNYNKVMKAANKAGLILDETNTFVER